MSDLQITEFEGNTLINFIEKVSFSPFPSVCLPPTLAET